MAKVSFKRIESSSNIESVPTIDGQIIYTKDGKTYLDYEGQRVVVNGTPDTAMSNSSTNAIANKTVKNYIDTNIQNVNSNIIKPFILWTNTNPSGAWANAQSITFNTSDYDMYEVIYAYGASSTAGSVKSTGKILKGAGTQLDFIYATSGGGNCIIRRRDFTYNNDTKYTVGVNTGADGDYACRPLYVIGYKTGLFQ